MKKHLINVMNLILVMKRIYIVIILAVTAVIIMNLSYKEEGGHFLGIAESREIIINSEYPVTIKKINVVPGQTVNEGDSIVELQRPELNKKINEITHQLEEYKTTLKANKNLIYRKTAELRLHHNLNKKLIKDIQKIFDKDNPRAQMPVPLPSTVNFKIKSLQQQLYHLNEPVKVKISMLEKEMKILEEEKKKLMIHAGISGVVGSLNYKTGEQVSPFDPIVTLHTKSPTFIKGFIHEKIYNEVFIGQQIEVVSAINSKHRTKGEVVGVGSRIVEFPERLRHRPLLKIWGREVTIQIPYKTGFLLGERVFLLPLEKISPNKTWSLVQDLHADTIENTNLVIKNIRLHEKIKSRMEASGIVHLPDTQKYLLISDDTYKKKPLLHIMNKDGLIEKEVTIKSMSSIDDMEAITNDGKGNYYIITSQNQTKKGKLPEKRKLLIHIKRDGDNFSLINKVNFFDLVQKVIQNSSSRLHNLAGDKGIIKLNIEGMCCYEGDLILGLKEPLRSNGNSILIKINTIESVLKNKTLSYKDISILDEILLPDHKNNQGTYITDLYLKDYTVYILSVSQKERNILHSQSGYLWSYSLQTKKLHLLKRFKNLKTEGITINDKSNKILITCDNGSKKPSQLITMEGWFE